MKDAVTRIITGLAQKPAYLLMFGICFLLFGGGTATGIVGTFTSNPPAQAWGFGTAAFTLFCTIIVILRVESLAKGTLLAPIEDQDFKPIFNAIFESVRQALTVNHDVFRSHMLSECEQFRLSTSEWADGHMRATDKSYSRLLAKVYSQAKRSVFATSTTDYLPIWKGVLGGQLIRAHVNNTGATVNRVFIFPSLSQVDNESIIQMKRQQESGHISILIYGIADDATFTFPRDQSQNFAVIDDGEVLTATDPVADGIPSGNFYFKDSDRQRTYKEIVDAITANSVSLEAFLSPSADPGNSPTGPMEEPDSKS